MTLHRQGGQRTCWAACIQLLQDLILGTMWSECCAADKTVTQTPPCKPGKRPGHPKQGPAPGDDLMLAADDFEGEASRCQVSATNGLTDEQTIRDALQDGVVTTLRLNHYQVVLRTCGGDHWCVYDPTWGDVAVERASRFARDVDRAWTTACDTVPYEDCCTGDA